MIVRSQLSTIIERMQEPRKCIQVLADPHQAGRIVINCFPLVFGLMLIESCTKVCQLRRDNGANPIARVLQRYCMNP